MYIGAWTEYRLAQEQLRAQRRQNNNYYNNNNAAKTYCDAVETGVSEPAVFTVKGNRKGAGIYHPSLSDKGGTEVAGLIPDRDSFRRVLENALSSNLAADDAEQISQALEPLMQRLPTIHVGQPGRISNGRRNRQHDGGIATSTLRRCHRQQKRRDRRDRYCTRGRKIVHTRSDVGTGKRSAGISPRSHDGTRSTRSGFSSASAPTAASAAMAESQGVAPCGAHAGHRRYRKTPTTLQLLPLIVDRKNRANATSNNNRSDAPDYSSCGSHRSEVPGARHTKNTATRTVGDSIASNGHCNVDGGYDGSKAASVLRVARRRDPTGLKADFQQFWRWKNAGQPSPDKQRQDTTTTAVSSVMSGVGTGGRQSHGATAKNKRKPSDSSALAARARLETLAKMKDVYLAKDNNITSTAATDDAVSTTPTPSEETFDATTTDVAVPRKSAAPAVPLRAVQLIGAPGTHGPSAVIDHPFTASEHKLAGNLCGVRHGGEEDPFGPLLPVISEPSVVVPDLELTESRIRQVEKYFGTGGRRQRHCPARVEGTDRVLASREQQQEVASAGRGVALHSSDHSNSSSSSSSSRSRSGTPCNDGGQSGGNRGGIDSYPCSANSGDKAGSRTWVIGDGVRCGGGVAADASSRHEKVGEQQQQQQQQQQPLQHTGSARAVASICRSREGQPSVTMEDHQEAAGVGSSAGGVAERQGGLKKQRLRLEKEKEEEEMDEGREDGRGMTSPAVPVSAVAPAWCGDSLEDLVCWTRGLDFDAAVEGY